MSGQGATARRGRLPAALVLAAFLAVAALAWTQAHPGGTAPALTEVRLADSTAGSDDVELTFTAKPSAELSHASVRDAAGTTVSSGTPRAGRGDTLLLHVLAAAPGVFTVSYHAAFADGRETSGEARFTADGRVADALSEAALSDAAAPSDAHEHGVDPVSGLLLGADVLVLVVVGLLLLRRPRVPD
jgi:methionine-rich copper-binding protein CopC